MSGAPGRSQRIAELEHALAIGFPSESTVVVHADDASGRLTIQVSWVRVPSDEDAREWRCTVDLRFEPDVITRYASLGAADRLRVRTVLCDRARARGGRAQAARRGDGDRMQRRARRDARRTRRGAARTLTPLPLAGRRRGDPRGCCIPNAASACRCRCFPHTPAAPPPAWRPDCAIARIVMHASAPMLQPVIPVHQRRRGDPVRDHRCRHDGQHGGRERAHRGGGPCSSANSR